MKPGCNNLITDVPGLRVGNADDRVVKTGVTVVTADQPLTASVQVTGGAPGTRETDLLEPDKLVDRVDALVLSGGSAMGLDAAGAVTQLMRESGLGYSVGSVKVPIVPAAILFDLLNGGSTDPSLSPYARLGKLAYNDCSSGAFPLGTVGAGAGATTANLKGGLGSASLELGDGIVVAALIAANPVGSANDKNTGKFWAAPFEIDREFGGFGTVNTFDATAQIDDKRSQVIVNPKANTTIGIVATNLALPKSALKRLAVSAHDGLARALLPSHTPFDGDLLFAVSTGEISQPDNATADARQQLQLGHAAAICVSRAIARGVFHATACDDDLLPTWKNRWGGGL